MNYYAATNTDKARFYISNAPRTAFSTAILNVSDFSPDMFFNIFERHMQSNAQEVINNGWHTTISLYILSNSYSKSRPRKRKTKPPWFYAHLSKSNSESGSGVKNDVATKHGREVRHGVFQIGKGNVKNSCLALSLLVGISYLHMDAEMY